MLIPWLTFVLLLALSLDATFGELKRFHPLVGFGNATNWLEKRLNRGGNVQKIILGTMAWGLLVLPVPMLLCVVLSSLEQLPLIAKLLLDAIVVYFAVALKSLYQHGMQIHAALQQKDIELARKYCGFIVSRETTKLTEQQISRATVESMLENGHDGVTATLIYYLIGGAPLVILHRLANTLDAMWGYKNSRFLYFGKFAARADDILGFVSGKITALLFALLGLRKCVSILQNACYQAKKYKSHNGGWVMSAGATLMNIKLGGSAVYHDKRYLSAPLGQGREVECNDIVASLKYVHAVVLLLLLLVLFTEVSVQFF